MGSFEFGWGIFNKKPGKNIRHKEKKCGENYGEKAISLKWKGAQHSQQA
jgi:hypothetical protein